MKIFFVLLFNNPFLLSFLLFHFEGKCDENTKLYSEESNVLADVKLTCVFFFFNNIKG